jgi:hypothetical protein
MQLATSTLGPASLLFASDGATNVEMTAAANILTLNDGGPSVRLANLAIPDAAADAATKEYVDGAVQGLSIKAAVLAASAVGEDSIPIAPADMFAGYAGTGIPAEIIALYDIVSIDGEIINVGDRVLLKDQLDPYENGLYVMRDDAMSETLFPSATFPVLVRADDMLPEAAAASAFAFVQQGATQGDTGWVCTNDADGDEVGASALSFAQFSSEGGLAAGTNLEKSGNTLHVADSPVFSGTITTSASVRATTGEIEGGSLIAGGLTLSDSLIEHASGTIPFGANNLTTAGTVTAAMLTATSDARLKTDVTDIGDALDTVMRLRGVRFEWKDDEQAAVYGPQVGFLAQEVREVVPQVVRVAEGTGIMSVAYANLVPLIVAAIQELAASVQALRGD